MHILSNVEYKFSVIKVDWLAVGVLLTQSSGVGLVNAHIYSVGFAYFFSQ
jgi:hypothetical protein